MVFSSAIDRLHFSALEKSPSVQDETKRAKTLAGKSSPWHVSSRLPKSARMYDPTASEKGLTKKTLKNSLW